LTLLVACAVLSGCLGSGRKETAEAVPPPVVTSDCYTVDLFTEAKVAKPADTVPDAYRAFLGEWGKGAWNDVWCHDLLITEVHPDGRVELFEMHAPYAPWGQPATAFRRTARIDRDGNLRFAYGTEMLSYQIVDGKLEGSRRGTLGNLHVSLVRRGVPPVPAPRLAAGETPPAPQLPAAEPAATPAPWIAGPGLPPIPPPRPVRLVQARAAMQPGT
jgi:hypothetical protein